IQTDRANLHVDGSPHVIRLTTIILWHFDAGSGRRPPHQLRSSRSLLHTRMNGISSINQRSCQRDVPKSPGVRAAAMSSAGEAIRQVSDTWGAHAVDFVAFSRVTKGQAMNFRVVNL